MPVSGKDGDAEKFDEDGDDGDLHGNLLRRMISSESHVVLCSLEINRRRSKEAAWDRDLSAYISPFSLPESRINNYERQEMITLATTEATINRKICMKITKVVGEEEDQPSCHKWASCGDNGAYTCNREFSKVATAYVVLAAALPWYSYAEVALNRLMAETEGTKHWYNLQKAH
jgi:hypothetical protein